MQELGKWCALYNEPIHDQLSCAIILSWIRDYAMQIMQRWEFFKPILPRPFKNAWTWSDVHVMLKRFIHSWCCSCVMMRKWHCKIKHVNVVVQYNCQRIFVLLEICISNFRYLKLKQIFSHRAFAGDFVQESVRSACSLVNRIHKSNDEFQWWALETFTSSITNIVTSGVMNIHNT